MVKDILRVWKLVFSNWKYTLSAIIVALGFYLFNVIIAQYGAIISFYDTLGFFGTMKFFIALSLGFGATIKTHSFVSLIIVSILFGMLLSLIIYKIKILKVEGIKGGSKKTGFFGTVGVFLAAFAPGCAACGIGLAALLGISGATLSLLPFEGLELSILAIVILSFVTWKVSKDLLNCKTCKIQLNSIKQTNKFK